MGKLLARVVVRFICGKCQVSHFESIRTVQFFNWEFQPARMVSHTADLAPHEERIWQTLGSGTLAFFSTSGMTWTPDFLLHKILHKNDMKNPAVSKIPGNSWAQNPVALVPTIHHPLPKPLKHSSPWPCHICCWSSRPSYRMKLDPQLGRLPRFWSHEETMQP